MPPPHHRTRLAALACLGGLLCLPAQAQQVASLAVVEISGHYDNAVGSSDAASQGSIGPALIRDRALQRPAEALEFVPGLVVTQHSGDGKANQYFLRGFNLDHGTDFATLVNGVPVNMPTHAHGQGYSDLNFLIPELLQRIDYRKGPYFAADGDFSSAGAADFVYRTRLERPLLDVSAGERGYARLLAAGSHELTAGQTLLLAFERMNHDGPWRVPEGLRKTNAVLTLSDGSAAQGWSASVMGYNARWTATDQVPQRVLDAGNYQGAPFGRFDSLDSSDGGQTSRHSLSAEWHSTRGPVRDRLAAYALHYDLDLYSNFTYALERPAQGDQFAQKDQRSVVGLSASRQWEHTLPGGRAMFNSLGVQLRRDRIRVGLYDSAARAITATVREDEVSQTLTGLYGDNRIDWTPWLRTVAGLRFDQLDATVDSLTLAANSGSTRTGRLSPKFSVVLGPWHKTEFFFNAGRGFHSNDARGTTARLDPRDGVTAQAPVAGLVGSRGQEVGLRTEAWPGLQSSLSLWQLDFDSELVYLGDAGSTEAGRPSRRHGVEWSTRWQAGHGWVLDADLAWTQARYADASAAGDAIPNAVARVAQLAASLRERGPWSASLHWRFIGAAPLNEDDSVRSSPSQTWNLRLGYRLHARAELYCDVFNLLDAKVNDIQYYYASRLRSEAASVNDLHVHPGEPRTLRLGLRLRF